MSNMNYEYVIIGGGVTGLCAAIRLTEFGKKPLVIEAGDYPSQKVCGEFFSPECLTILQKWNIHPVTIQQATFHFCSEVLSFRLPSPAGSLSHFECDPQLKKLAINNGATVLVQTKVMRLNPGLPLHVLELSTGETIQTPNLLIATGRIPQYDTPVKLCYKGIKAHFENLPLKNTLEMFILDGAYVGVSQIENGKFNVACLVDIATVNQIGPIAAVIQHITSKNRMLHEYITHGKCLFTEWMSTSLPEFGVKITPFWPHVYFIGDAAGTIPPITGQGLSMGMRSGIMAAEFAKNRDASGFKKAWKRQFASPIFWGKLLHQMSMHPYVCSKMIQLGKVFPSLINSAYQLTR